MSFKIERGRPEDAEALGRIFVQTEDSEFLRLQIGTADLSAAVQGMAAGLKQSLENPSHLVVVARDSATSEPVSFAQWIHTDEEVSQTAEEFRQEIDRRREYIKPGMNTAFLVEIWEKMFNLRARALQGRKHYLLANISTAPEYRRRGLASQIVQYGLDCADRAGIIAYLDTENEGQAIKLYQRLGFATVAEVHFDLTKYGGTQADHVHVAMIREPRPVSLDT